LGHLLVAVAALAQPALLLGGAGGVDEDEERVGVERLDGLSPGDVDLEQDVAARGRGRDGRALAVVEELDPLEEPPVGDVGVERLGGDEVVRVLGLAGPATARGPGAAQPQPRILGDQPGDERALPGPARTGDDDDQGDLPSCRWGTRRGARCAAARRARARGASR
jgi:hypothetical protein